MIVEGRSVLARAVIMLHLGGGPPHMDMYEPKPTAPAEFRSGF